ncbi:MAG: hypothetical protein JWP11_3804 [Frankiales bacterium]|nr:hypothetical protein [Frankiales bacterium]
MKRVARLVGRHAKDGIPCDPKRYKHRGPMAQTSIPSVKRCLFCSCVVGEDW